MGVTASKKTFSLSQVSKASLLVLCHGEKTKVFIPRTNGKRQKEERKAPVLRNFPFLPVGIV